MRGTTLGVGLGFRPEIAADLLADPTAVDWIELITERHIQTTPDRRERAVELSKSWPVVPHGIDLSIGSPEPLDREYIDELAALCDDVDAPWFSDHLCFTRAGGLDLGQLTPLHRTHEAVALVAAKAKEIQAHVGRPFLLENITYYVDLASPLADAEFLTAVVEQADCGILLDLENVLVNAANHGFDALAYVDSLPLERVRQVHLAGGHMDGNLRLDTHAAAVPDDVWALLDEVVARCPDVSVLIERDAQFPPFPELRAEVDRARAALRPATV